jgi:ribosomal protein S18
MTKDVQLLKQFISEALHEAWDPINKRFDTVDSSKAGEAEAEKYDKKLKRNASTQDYEKNVSSSFEDSVEELRDEPEYKSVETFVRWMMSKAHIRPRNYRH